MQYVSESIWRFALPLCKKIIARYKQYRIWRGREGLTSRQVKTVSDMETHMAAAGGERQASPYITGIRADHRARYAFAKQYIMQDANVMDLACGVGYGSHMIANETNCASIVSVDVSGDAIAYGEKYYNSPKIDYMVSDCLSMMLEPESFDIVLCFETIEHIADDKMLLENIYRAIKPQGRLLCSVPNQTKIPFSIDTHPFHIRHYTPEEFKGLLELSGFNIEQLWSQNNHFSSEVRKGADGLCIIAVCIKSLRRHNNFFV